MNWLFVLRMTSAYRPGRQVGWELGKRTSPCACTSIRQHFVLYNTCRSLIDPAKRVAQRRSTGKAGECGNAVAVNLNLWLGRRRSGSPSVPCAAAATPLIAAAVMPCGSLAAARGCRIACPSSESDHSHRRTAAKQRTLGRGARGRPRLGINHPHPHPGRAGR